MCRKQNTFWNLTRNFLAIWAAVLLAVFLSVLFLEMLVAIIENAAKAFEYATNLWTVLIGLASAVIVTIITRIVELKKTKKSKEV